MSEPYFGVFIGGSSARSISDLARRSSLDVYVSCSDDGGSTGRINRYCQENNGLTILPPGDIRRVIGALSPYLCEIDPKTSAWEYRFESDEKGPLDFGQLIDLIRKEADEIEIPEALEVFRGSKVYCDTIQEHPLGNLVLASRMLGYSGNDGNLRAVRNLASELDCRGRIIPVFGRFVKLFYKDAHNDEPFEGEYTLGNLERESYPIDSVWIQPTLTYNPEFKKSLKDANAVVFGPTSQVGNIWACLPENVPELPTILRLILEKPIIYSSPLMTEKNQTSFDYHDLRGLGHLELLRRILKRNISEIVDVIVRPGPYEQDYNGILESYERECSTPVWWRQEDIERLGILDFPHNDLVEVLTIEEEGVEKTVLRHNPEAHVEAVLQAYEQISSQ